MPFFPRSALIAMLAAAVSAGCGQTIGVAPSTASINPAAAPAAPGKSGPVKIAMLLPLGGFGESAQTAKGMKQAAELALFDANNPAVEFIAKNDGGTEDGARRAAEEAISEGANIILGPLLAASVRGARPVAQKAGVPIIAFSNDQSLAGGGVHLLSFIPSDEIDRATSFAVAKGRKRFVALVPADANGKVLETSFRSALERAGGELVALESYPDEGSGRVAAAKRIGVAVEDGERSGQPVEALFFPASRDLINQIAPVLTYAGVDFGKVKLVGTSALDGAGGDSVSGAWFAATDSARWSDFSAKFSKTFGAPPPRLATLAYDAMSVTMVLAASTAPDRFSAANLTRAAGFMGVDGAFKFRPSGVAEHGLAMFEIEGDKTRIIDAAPLGVQGGAVTPQVSSANSPSVY